MRRQGGFFCSVKIIIILAMIGAGFFYAQKVWADQGVLINEIQIYPAGHRFIELYNTSGSSVDLTGWSVKKKTSGGKEDSLLASSRLKGKFILSKGYLLLTNEEGYSGNAVADVAWAKSYSIAKDNTVILYDNNQTIIDKVGFGQATDCEGSCAINPDENYSIQRNAFIDTNNSSSDFFIQENPNPQNSTSGAVNPPNPPLQGGQESVASSTPELTNDNTASTTEQAVTPPNPPLQAGQDAGGAKINFGEVVINELVSDPADNEVEWLELYNKSGQNIDLAGWWIEDGSKAKTNLSGSLDKYKVIEKPNGNLNNDGDLVVLYDAAGRIIDQIAYGNWPDGNLDDNAPSAHDPDSVVRKFDGYNTFNNANDFAVTIKPTKGAANLVETEAEVSLAAKAKFDFSPEIFITEIMPNPDGDDSKLEFIEIFNAAARPVDLTGWSLSNEDGKKKNLENLATSTLIGAGEYLALYRPKTKIILHNDQGEARLFQPLADKAMQIAAYKNVEEGWSYNLTPLTPLLKGGEWTWSETLTPGAANVIKAANHAPEVSFSFKSPAPVNTAVMFDSSDTADADGDKLTYAWDFGDGFKNALANPDHTYAKTGIYKVKLAVSDGKETAEKEKSVKVVGNPGDIANVREIASLPPVARNDNVVINEVLPNPEGADTGREWLELKNKSAGKINLLNWRVENGNGKYKFANDLWLEAGNFYVLDNSLSQLAFKNSSDVINLYNDLDELADSVEYASAVQGESYARGANGKWFWTTKLTPGSENIISAAESGERIMNNELRITRTANQYVETTLEKVRDLEVGSLVKVKGTVAVEPGILGAQIFYIVGSPGMQIYNYKKDFPALKVGDYVEVQGELAQTQAELRIKTKDKTDIKIAAHQAPPVALAVASDAVNEDNVGQLVVVSGEITDKKSSTIYLDDGNDEVLVYIKKNTGISTKNLAPGQIVAVTGIVSKTSGGARLLPRSKDDIAVIAGAAAELAPQVLGEVASGNEWEVAARDKKNELFKYLLIIAGGIVIVLAGLLVKAGKKVKS
ncbi:MAG: lamin tail domain-containing protein [bacterium]|nr:lamin tail domain-containing protein [bacterium]